MQFTIHSMRKEHIRTYNNRSENYEDNIMYVLNCKNENNYKYEIKMWEINGDCPSGWCAASWGYITCDEVQEFSGYTHKPIKKLTFEMVKTNHIDYIENDIFTVSYECDDHWYPNGFVRVNEELFEVTSRYKDKRPVWIFKGHSGLGKSYLAGIINNSSEYKSIYETDEHSTLTKIDEDIIVIGNKYDYSVADVESMIQGEHETIIVDFSEYKEREISRGE